MAKKANWYFRSRRSQSNMKRNVSSLQPKTLKAKIIVALVLIWLFLFVFISIILYQNQRKDEIVEQIAPLRLPALTLSNSITNGLNRSALKQQYYLITRETIFREERMRIWQETIEPSIKKLVRLRNRTEHETLRNNLDSVIVLVERYQQDQEKIERFFEDYIRKGEEGRNLSNFDQNLNTLLRTKALQSLNRLEQLLENFNGVQNQKLKQNIAEVQYRIGLSNSTIIGFTAIVAIFSLVFAVIFIRNVEMSIQKPIQLLRKLSRGELPKQIEASEDELSEVVNAGNALSLHLKEASLFAQEIGESKFDGNFSPKGEKDILGNSLVQMRNKLQKVSEEERKRNWVTEGMAKFSEILRTHNTSFRDLGDSILPDLVEYIEANQAALFVFQESESESARNFLELVSTYAYKRKKFIYKEIPINTEHARSLVEQCFLEQRRIHIADMPQDYLEIKSGLGGASPNHLLIVPLKVNEKIEGVLEVASFEAFDHFDEQFLEQLASSIASTISAARNSEQTQQLLSELQSQAQAMRAQEEEMRQNMEELQATQEKMRRNEAERETLLQDVRRLASIVENHPDFIGSGDLSGDINYINPAGLEMLGLPIDYDLKKVQLHSILAPEDADKLMNRGLSKALKTGIWKGEGKLLTQDKTLIPVEEIISVNYNSEGEAISFSLTLRDISEEQNQAKKVENYQKTLLDILDCIPGKIFIKDKNGAMLFANNEVAKVYERDVKDLIGTTDFDFFEHDLAQSYRDQELEIMELGTKTYIQEEELTGELRYLKTTKMPFYITYLDQKGLLGIQIDVTENMVLENKVRSLERQLKKLQKDLRRKENQIAALKS